MSAPLRDRSDEEVATAARESPQEAFGILFERYRGPVHAHLARTGAPADRIDDLFQTVFLRTFRAIRTFRGESRFKTWLFTIATNVVMDEWRRAGRQGSTTNLEAVAVPVEDRSGRDAERNEAVGLVRRAVQALPEPSRTLFLLVRFQGMGIAEAARTAGMNPATAKVALFRLQQKVGAEIARLMNRQEDRHVS